MTGISPFLFSSDPALTQLHAGSFTVSFGYKPKSFSLLVPQTLCLAPAFFVAANVDGTITFTINNSPTSVQTSVTSLNPIITGWNFIAVTYDLANQKLSIYLNGNTTTASFTSPADASDASFATSFQFGTNDRVDAGSSSSSFDLDEASVWARVLTSAELDLVFGGGTLESYPFLGGPFNMIFQGELVGAVEKPLVLGSGRGLWSVAKSFDSGAQQFTATLQPLFFKNLASLGYSWSAENFNDKIIFAQHDNRAQYWTPPSPTAQDLPGLPTDNSFVAATDDALWDGVTVFANHALLWKGDRLKWSDLNDFTMWIPVATTAISTALTLNTDFIQPPVGGNISVPITNVSAEVKSISLDGDLAFAPTLIGTTLTSLFLIINSGNTNLTVTGISLPDGFSGSFSGVIPPNSSQPVLITFAPVEAISYDGAVIVASDATTGTSVFPISGTGTGFTKIISLDGVLNFGETLAGVDAPSTLIINNLGNSTLTITGITAPTGLRLGTHPSTIAAGARALVTATYDGSVPVLSGSIVVTSDATSGDNTITVSGKADSSPHPADFATDNGTCQFGNVPVGSTATGTIRLWSFTSSTGHGVNYFTPTLPEGFTTTFVGPANISGPGGFVDIPITFSPVSPKSYGGLMLVSSSNPAPGGARTGTTSCSLSGVGTAVGKIISLAGNLLLGDTPVNGHSYGLLKISNVGTVALTVTSLSLPTGFSAIFSGVIPPGVTKDVQVSFQPTSAITFSGNITVNSDATGTNTIAVSGKGVAIPQPATLVSGQVVSLVDPRAGVTYYNFYSVVSASSSNLVLTLLSLTGATPSGLTIPADGRQFFTVDANEAGEDQIAGENKNGPIFKVIPQGDYAYSFKERSIQSIQYTGLGNGTFFIHNEVSGEGLISREAVVNRGDGTMVFLGHRELYAYQGGPNIIPVCQQTTRQLYKELDNSRLEAIRLFHNENRKEIWVQYPVTGGFKVLIWNYIEDSSSIDLYDPQIQFSALGKVDWVSNLTTGFTDHAPLLASQDGNIRIHGRVYNRDGAGYLALSETMDFDLQNPDIYKYVDVVVLGLDVKVPETTPRLMTVQVGSQASLSGKNIVWTAPQTVLVNGQAVEPVKVNPGGAGRYLRIRFSSSDPNVQWRVSSFELHCRPGNSY